MKKLLLFSAMLLSFAMYADSPWGGNNPGQGHENGNGGNGNHNGWDNQDEDDEPSAPINDWIWGGILVAVAIGAVVYLLPRNNEMEASTEEPIMQACSIKELSDEIERDNLIFEGLSPAEKRMKVAQDALLRIKFHQLKPRTGAFAQYSGKFWGVPIKDILNDELEEVVCTVCAKGALFMSYVGRVNKETFTQWGMSNDPTSDEHKKLREIFDNRQLAAIEYAFEGQQFINSVVFSRSERADFENFYFNNSSDVERLKLICENIIANKGEFKL